MSPAKALLVAMLLVLAACGGGEDTGASGDGSSDDASGAAGDGAVVDAPPAGQATVSVEGNEYELEVSPALGCEISPEAITFSFWVGDNSIVLGGGANLYDDGWLGNVSLTVYEPEGEDGPIAYYPDLVEDGDRISIDGDSMSYSGPMLKQPPNDGSNPPPVAAGDGTISVTCG